MLPLDFKNGLPYLRCRKPTDRELASFPHIIMTSDCEWDPSKFDKDLNDLAAYYDPSEEDHEGYHFDQHGEYRHCTVATHATCLEEEF
jgi:hypothetical protein